MVGIILGERYAPSSRFMGWWGDIYDVINSSAASVFYVVVALSEIMCLNNSDVGLSVVMSDEKCCTVAAGFVMGTFM